ncbi:MAG: glucose-6-phosphate isomerase [Bacilli bacterium]|nr:glucose-6-phosphate isomerase [Bacilli bacterium]
MLKVNFDYVNKNHLVNFNEYRERVAEVDSMIKNKTGAGNDFLGWYDWPKNYDKEELERIIKKANHYIETYDTLVVCGIGGSYLGAVAAIDAINGLLPTSKMKIVYLGNTLDPNYVHETLSYLKDKNFAVCCISKSGTTTETSVSFRILKEMVEEKYGKEKAKDAIVCVTDKARGALKTLANKEGYETYILPDDIGGRYSVITAVGLFPIACAGIDVKELLAGCYDAMLEYDNPDINKNMAYQYALERHYLYQKFGYKVEMLGSYEPRFRMLNEWWKQLYGESEGKEGKGILPTSCVFTTDLHSLGQYIQDGEKILFETILYIEKPNFDVTVISDKEDLDGLNYLAGKKLSFINKKAYEGTLEAHSKSGGVDNICLTLDEMSPRALGHLFYFFMKACAMSAYLNEINPFNQPGVEIYKKNMFHLLGKKGY